MVAAKVWKGEDIAREKVRMYRKIYRLSNTISNKAIMNITPKPQNPLCFSD